MAHAIPKIEYNLYTLAGDTNSGTAVIDNVDTTNIVAGMRARGANIPAGTTVITVDSATQVTLSANSTGTVSAVAIDFFKEISFDYPPIEPGGEKYDPQETNAISRSGVRQTSSSYIEVSRSLVFSFIRDAIKLQYQNFFLSWGYLGKSFRYYDDKTTTNYIDYELKDLKFEPKKITARSSSEYVWQFGVTLRRVL